MKRLEVFLLPLDGMLVHRRSLPRNFVRFPQEIAGTHLYTWVERGTVRVKCLAQEHNTLSPARARTRTARSGVERTNHEATAPPRFNRRLINITSFYRDQIGLTANPKTTPKSEGKKVAAWIIIVSVLGGLLLFGLAGFALYRVSAIFTAQSPTLPHWQLCHGVNFANVSLSFMI